jgi:hypothetical protein
MSAVSPPSRRQVGTWVAAAAAAASTLVAVALFGPAVEELRVQASRAHRRNVLSNVALAAAPSQVGYWSPVWDGPGGAVPDYLADVPHSLIDSEPRAGWEVPRTVVLSLTPRQEIKPVELPRAAAHDYPGYFPNWDLFEPAGIRQVSSPRRTRHLSELTATKPAAQSPPAAQPNVRHPAGPLAPALAID